MDKIDIKLLLIGLLLGANLIFLFGATQTKQETLKTKRERYEEMVKYLETP